MMRDLSQGREWLSINTATVRAQWSLEEIIEALSRHQIPALSPWRDQVAKCGLKKASSLVKGAGLKLSGYCRGGMFSSMDAAGQKAADDDNRRAVDEAAELDSACLVLVVGGLPGALAGKALSHDIGLARQQVQDGIGRLLDYAKSCNMPLAIEPLHPMYAADRACVNTLEQALDLCDRLDPEGRGGVGVAIDCYHVWWDPALLKQIARAGAARRILAFHVCDWLVPTKDMLNDRGLMGDGVIDIKAIRGAVEATGFAGYSEVEIFSHDLWAKSMDAALELCIARHRAAV
jgi:sugar phosphate isomerase/epimerase